MESDNVEILLEDGPCLLVNKPAGLLTQAPPGIESLEVRLRDLLTRRLTEPGSVYLGVPHRLDRPASGALVFALSLKAARRLSIQFERRTVGKLYWALVEGWPSPVCGTWTDRLWKVHGQPRSVVVDASHAHGQDAILHYTTLGRHAHGAWLEIELETGRTHQVRVQAASRGHPLLGDRLYGATTSFGPEHEDERLNAIALHARRLSLLHPISRTNLVIEAPTSAAWQTIGLTAQDFAPTE